MKKKRIDKLIIWKCLNEDILIYHKIHSIQIIGEGTSNPLMSVKYKSNKVDDFRGEDDIINAINEIISTAVVLKPRTQQFNTIEEYREAIHKYVNYLEVKVSELDSRLERANEMLDAWKEDIETR